MSTSSVSPVPAQRRPQAIAFVDGMNLYNAAKALYGYHYPMYDVRALASAVCAKEGWDLVETRFYVGLPEEAVDPRRHHWWNAKLREMRRNADVKTWTRTV